MCIHAYVPEWEGDGGGDGVKQVCVGHNVSFCRCTCT